MICRTGRYIAVVVALLVTAAAGWCFDLLPEEPGQQAQDWLEVGIKQAEQGNYDVAIASIKKAIQLQPRLQSAYYNLGFICYQAGKPQQAVSYYHEALKLDPGDLDSRRGLGLAYAAQEKWSHAAAVFNDLLQMTPDDSEVAIQLGRTYLEMGQPDKATSALQKATTLAPKNPLAHLYLGRALTLTGQFTQAAQHLLQAQELKPDSEQIKLELLNLYVESGQLLSAQSLAEELVAKHPDNEHLLQAQIEIYEGLGLDWEKQQAQEALLAHLPPQQALVARAQLVEEYLSEGRWEQALPHLKLLHEAQPGNPSLIATLARCYLRTGQGDKAFEVLQAGLEASPEQPELATMLGDLYVGRRQLKQALEAYQQALAAQRDYVPALQAAIQVSRELGRSEQTLPWLRRLVAIKPADWEARMMLADQLASARQPGPAMYQFSQIASRSDDEELAEIAHLELMQLAEQTGNQGYQAYLYRQNVPEAELDSAGLSREHSPQQMTKSRLEALVAENPESLGAKALLAEYYLQVGNLEQAGAIADEILQEQSGHGQGNYLMGRVLQQQGNFKQALPYLRKAIAAQPTAIPAYEALIQCTESINRLPLARDFLTSVLADTLGAATPDQRIIHLIVHYLGHIYEQIGGSEHSAAELTALSDAYPDSAPLALEVARVLASSNQLQQAAHCYKRAARLPKYGNALAEAALLLLPEHPDDALALANDYLARIVQDSKALELIVEMQGSSLPLNQARKQALAKLLSSQPRSSDYEMAKVGLWKQAGRLIEAEAHFAAQVVADQDNSALRAALAYALWLQERKADALTQLNQLPAQAFQNSNLRIFRATALAATGDRDQAIDELGRVLVDNPANPQAKLMRADLLSQAGKYQEALWELGQTLVFHPEIEQAGDAVVAMIQEGKLPVSTVLLALDQAHAIARQPEVVRKLVPQLGKWADQEAVEQWLANHPRLDEGE